MRKLIFILTLCLLAACTLTNRQLTPEEEKLREDSIFHERRLAIQDSLSKIEGDTIIHGIYFGMTESDYNRAIAKLKEETDGVIQIGSKEYNEMNAQFDNGRLYSFSLSCTYRTSNTISKNLDDCQFDNKDKVIREEAFLHFIDKYGDPDWCYKTQENEYYSFHRTDTCPAYDAEGMMWKLNYKYIRAEQQLEDAEAYSDNLCITYKFIISFFSPSIYNRLEAEEDSITQAEIEKYQRKSEEKHKKQTKYTYQL